MRGRFKIAKLPQTPKLDRFLPSFERGTCGRCGRFFKMFCYRSSRLTYVDTGQLNSDIPLTPLHPYHVQQSKDHGPLKSEL